MGEFHDTVSTLLDAFSRGLSIIKSHKKNRSKEQCYTKSDPQYQLSRSLKKNRRDVKNAYGRELAQFGPDFAAGDAEARSSLARILTRLSTGFLSIFERFIKGRSTSSDYQALLSLSNSTRAETIQTFDQLSKRLSSSSLSLATAKKPRRDRADHKHKAKKTSARTKSAPDLSLTPLGPASSSGWIRPKPGRRQPPKSQSLGSINSERNETRPLKTHRQPQRPLVSEVHSRSPTLREHRRSIMSFASDSTNLGEIPERKWTRAAVIYEAGDAKFPITMHYPLERYEEPVKQRSRFMRLFSRQSR